MPLPGSLAPVPSAPLHSGTVRPNRTERSPFDQIGPNKGPPFGPVWPNGAGMKGGAGGQRGPVPGSQEGASRESRCRGVGRRWEEGGDEEETCPGEGSGAGEKMERRRARRKGAVPERAFVRSCLAKRCRNEGGRWGPERAGAGEPARGIEREQVPRSWEEGGRCQEGGRRRRRGDVPGGREWCRREDGEETSPEEGGSAGKEPESRRAGRGIAGEGKR